MKKLEAIDALFRFNSAFQDGSIAGMANAVGLTDELVERMSIEDLGDAIAVRVADLMKVANPEGKQ